MNSTSNYLFEINSLKRIKRSGWWLAGVKDPESVAEHSFTTAIIAYVLAKMEGENPEKLACAALWHDVHESRLLDHNKVTARYLPIPEKIEKKIREEQMNRLSPNLKQSINSYFKLTKNEFTILKDADYLECAFQAKEYVAQGYSGCNWLKTIEKRLKTPSAKKLMKELKNTKPYEWWKKLKNI